MKRIPRTELHTQLLETAYEHIESIVNNLPEERSSLDHYETLIQTQSTR